MKEIKNFKKYYATTCGKIIAKSRKCVMSTYLDTVGYKCVNLRDEEGNIKHLRVHRLIATTYLDISDPQEQINHIDGNKLNCCILNLEIMSNKENTEHGYDTNLYTTRSKINIDVYNKNMEFLFSCKSMRECERKTNISRKLIALYIKGLRNNISDYEFKITSFDKPFRILDEQGNDFRSCRQCALFYGFDESKFNLKMKANDEIIYENLKFKKYFV